ncbi:cupin domain-containing protein [Opitutia bacterium ISCC 51]|nr:cupin domain-containing protein [Opitutae bacterium ISCC 51]QXD29357.1 cupin domain-containing protein [Opitutae bacterium ISCC 52]
MLFFIHFQKRPKTSMKLSIFTTLVLSSAALLILSRAHADAHEHQKSVVPEAETKLDAALAHEGPSESINISAELIGAVDLKTVRELEGKQARVRLITIEPGGKVAVHQHDDRPGLALILSGVAVEYRGKKAIHHRPGSVAFEQDGDTHWWHNPYEEETRALVVDILPKE